MKNLISAISKTIVLASAASVFTACASLQDNYQTQYCNHDGGFAKGQSDAKDGAPLDRTFGQNCTLETADSARGGYHAGYQAGLVANAQKPTPTMASATTTGSGDHKYYCEIQAFQDTFSGYGSDELKAQLSAKAACEKQYHEAHCKEFTCRH